MPIEKYREAIRLLLENSMTKKSISKLVGLSNNTVKKCCYMAKNNGWSWDTIREMDDRELASYFKKVRDIETDKVMPDWSDVHKKMQQKHQVRIELWESYRDEYKAQAYSYSQFNHYYRLYLEKVDLCMRQVHYAGEIIYVDYAGKTIPYRDCKTGEVLHAQIFVGVMACSNYTFAFASASQKLRDWIEAHKRMFVFFGGVPKIVVPDNLKSAVSKTGKFFELNKIYRELAEYYGFAIVPARPYRPQDKSKAEIGVKLVSQWISIPLCRQQFFSVDEINHAITPLLKKFNRREFRRLPGSREERFEELDKPELKSLPALPFEYGEWINEQKVGPDYHIYVEGHAYSVPYNLAGQKVEARISAKTVEVFYLNKRIATHLRDDRKGEATTNDCHRPASHRAYASQTVDYYLQWAQSLGLFTSEVVEKQFEGQPEFSLSGRKACSQLKALERQYGDVRLECACQRAVEIQSPTVTSVRSILQHRLDEAVQTNKDVKTRIPEHQNIRGVDYYAPGGSHHA